ncbi:MAG: hypothetical protein E3J76_04830 [Candidatus Aminicenantes bacterium]|nr:MAG: hypothetical protein E3J76_04830 [Candidatus Aminicenantes bacterium]
MKNKNKVIGEILFGKQKCEERMKGVLHVKFRGKKYLLVGGLASGGAITTRKAYENFEVSYAHLFSNGDVMRHRRLIGTRDDIEVLKKR